MGYENIQGLFIARIGFGAWRISGEGSPDPWRYPGFCRIRALLPSPMSFDPQLQAENLAADIVLTVAESAPFIWE